MSYQARIANPPLSVTGRIGACGNTKRSGRSPARTSSGTSGSKSWPSAPRPWRGIAFDTQGFEQRLLRTEESHREEHELRRTQLFGSRDFFWNELAFVIPLPL